MQLFKPWNEDIPMQTAEAKKKSMNPLAMLAVALLTGAAAVAIAKTDWKKGALPEPMSA